MFIKWIKELIANRKKKCYTKKQKGDNMQIIIVGTSDKNPNQKKEVNFSKINKALEPTTAAINVRGYIDVADNFYDAVSWIEDNYIEFDLKDIASLVRDLNDVTNAMATLTEKIYDKGVEI